MPRTGVIERLGDTRSQRTILITTATAPSQEVIDAEEARVLALRAPSQEVIDAEMARQEALRAQQAAHASRTIDVEAQPGGAIDVVSTPQASTIGAVAQPGGAVGVSDAGAIDVVPQPSRAIDGMAQPRGATGVVAQPGGRERSTTSPATAGVTLDGVADPDGAVGVSEAGAIDVVAQLRRAMDGGPQPALARLEPPAPNSDTPDD